jgi:RNA polymerase sigma-70 factor (ECF subfamily)
MGYVMSGDAIDHAVLPETARRAAIRAGTQLRVHKALSAMDPTDRAVQVLRHFEILSDDEAAQVLGLKPSAASSRYLRAQKRLKEIMP